MIHSITEFLARPTCKITSEEYRLICFLLRELQGYQMRVKVIETSSFVNGTGLFKQHVHASLKSLVQKGVLIKIKSPGIRSSFWGFNEKKFGNTIVTQDEKTTQVHQAKVIDLVTFKVTKEVTLKGTGSVLSKSSRTATSAGLQSSKDSIKIFKDISQREILDFLNSQKSKAVKNRWEKRIQEILKHHPEDESLLWFSIELVQKTGKDLLGNPIYSSVIGLFEKTEWELMRTILIAKMNEVQADNEKKQRAEENRRRVQETRRQLLSESSSVEDTDPSRAKEECHRIVSILKGVSA